MLSKKEKVGVGAAIVAVGLGVAVTRAKAAPKACTLGKTKCMGFDLYECSPFPGGEPKWVLVEANSTDCGWTPGEAEFQVTDLVITPSEVYVGEPVSISALVKNIGGQRGTKTVTLEVS